MTSSETVFLQSSEWRHILRVYGQPGVAQACLLLQDSLGVDVLVMLHLGYVCQQHGRALPQSQIEAADALVRDWRNQVVRPLRAARRAIAKEDPATQPLRAAIQQAELAAEQHALAQLAMMPMAADGPPAAGARSPAQLVAAFYARRNACEQKLDPAEITQAISLVELASADTTA